MFIQEKGIESVKRWIKDMSNQELVAQIHMFETIIEFDNSGDFVFLDEIIEIHYFMLEESVERLAKSSTNSYVCGDHLGLSFEEMLK